MFHKYKEIFYGLLFGLGAAVLDTFMDAGIEQQSFLFELVQYRTMVFYRFMFVLFGLALGWLLWQKNRRERDARHLTETLRRFQHEYGAAAVLIHAKLQILLTKENLNLSRDAEELIRSAYERSQTLQALLKEQLPAEL
jgi:hypothetical protein